MHAMPEEHVLVMCSLPEFLRSYYNLTFPRTATVGPRDRYKLSKNANSVLLSVRMAGKHKTRRGEEIHLTDGQAFSDLLP